MYKFTLPVIAAVLLISPARAEDKEFVLTCAWDLGSKFQLTINEKGVAKNGRTMSEHVTIDEDQVAWHEAGVAGYDYDYTINRHSGVLVASSFSKTYNRKVENKAICVKAGGSEQPGF
jgi:hypothetical protein